MDNSLSLVSEPEICQVEGLDIVLQGRTLQSAVFLIDKRFDSFVILPGGCRHVLRRWRC